jgi:hypothetical protein
MLTGHVSVLVRRGFRLVVHPNSNQQLPARYPDGTFYIHDDGVMNL